MDSSQPENANENKPEQRQRLMRRVSLALAPFSACMGMIAFFGVASNPRFEMFHTVDVIRLMTAGAGIAVTIFTLILFFKSAPGSEDNRAG